MTLQYGKERTKLLNHFAQVLIDQNDHLGNLRTLEAQHREQVAKDLEAWWAANGHLYLPPDYMTGDQMQAMTDASGAIKDFMHFQHGGPVRRTGLALVHEDEHVLNPDTTRTLSRMMGEPVTQRGLIAAMGSRAGGDTYHLTANVNVTGEGNDARLIRQIEDAVSDKMMEVVQKVTIMRGKASAA